MSRPLYRPSRNQWIWLAVSGGAALAFAFYLRYRVLEVPAVSIACESGGEGWHCMARKAAITMFTPMAFGGAALTDDLAPVIAHVAVLAPYAHQIALAVVVVGITFVSLILGELVPKRFALHYPEAIASRIAASTPGSP